MRLLGIEKRMKLKGLDIHARDSPFQAIDPRVKLLSLLCMIITVSFMRELLSLGIALVFSLVIITVSRIPARHLFSYFGISAPFIIFTSLTLFFTSGTETGIAMLIRTSTAVLLLLFLGTTTPFFELLRGFQSLRMPNIYVMMLLFVYRYIFVISDELSRMQRARKARAFTGGRKRNVGINGSGGRKRQDVEMGVRGRRDTGGEMYAVEIKDSGEIKGTKRRSMEQNKLAPGIVETAGMVLVRSYERGKEFQNALKARGFTGEIRTKQTMKTGRKDIVFSGIVLCCSFLFIVLEQGVVLW